MIEIFTTLQQYLLGFFAWLAGLFTKAQWGQFVLASGVVVLMVLATTLVTQLTKFLWRLSPVTGDNRRGLVRLMTCGIGVGFGHLLWPPEWYLPWWFAGFVFGGGGALLVWGVAWPVFSTRWPEVAAKINAQED